MNRKPYHDILDSAAADSLHKQTNLWPKISARIERKSLMQTIRTKPLLIVLVVILILLLLTGVVYAIGNLMGYIPGIGMVEQSSALRALDKPVSVERDGIRLTVLNVVASSSNTIIRYQVEWLTPPLSNGKYDTSCQGASTLTLSHGGTLNFVHTADKFLVGNSGTGYGYVVEFAPVPVGQNDVTLNIPCLVSLATGTLPRDWKISFHIIPAPEGMVLPVSTVAVPEPTAAPATETASPSHPTLPPADPNHRIKITADSFVKLNDGYLLVGSFHWSNDDYPAYGVNPISETGYLKVVDANGKDVAWESADGNVTPQNEEYRSYWAVKILSKDFAAPLTIMLNAADVQIKPVAFKFDIGSNAKIGQSWDVNQNLQIAGRPIKVLKATLIFGADNNPAFQFDVQVDPNAIGDLHLNTSLSQCMGGGGGYPTDHVSLLQVDAAMCRPDLPPGSVDMQVIGAFLWGQWQVTWQLPLH